MEPKKQHTKKVHDGPPAAAGGAEKAGENGAGDGGEEKSGEAFNRGREKQSKRTSVRRSLPALIDVDDLNGLLDTEG